MKGRRAYGIIYNCVFRGEYSNLPETLSRNVVYSAQNIAYAELIQSRNELNDGLITKDEYKQFFNNLMIVLGILDSYEKAYYYGVCHKPGMLI